jgi:hypothetical protein
VYEKVSATSLISALHSGRVLLSISVDFGTKMLAGLASTAGRERRQVVVVVLL